MRQRRSNEPVKQTQRLRMTHDVSMHAVLAVEVRGGRWGCQGEHFDDRSPSGEFNGGSMIDSGCGVSPVSTRLSVTMMLMREPNGVDEYGLRVGIFGLPPNEFYSTIGRVVCVCAVLEDKVTSLRHALDGAGQGTFTHEPVSTQIRRIRHLSQRLPEPGPGRIRAFCDKAKAAFHHRNALVHSSFPAQPDARVWGHRQTRDRTITDGTAETVETTIDELCTLIRELARLVVDFNTVHPLASQLSIS